MNLNASESSRNNHQEEFHRNFDFDSEDSASESEDQRNPNCIRDEFDVAPGSDENFFPQRNLIKELHWMIRLLLQ